jgi:hypothetical protein
LGASLTRSLSASIRARAPSSSPFFACFFRLARPLARSPCHSSASQPHAASCAGISAIASASFMSGEAKRAVSAAWPGAPRATKADPGNTSPLPDAWRSANIDRSGVLANLQSRGQSYLRGHTLLSKSLGHQHWVNTSLGRSAPLPHPLLTRQDWTPN